MYMYTIVKRLQQFFDTIFFFLSLTLNEKYSKHKENRHFATDKKNCFVQPCKCLQPKHTGTCWAAACKDVSLFLGWESAFHRALPDLWRAALRAGLFLTFRPLTNLISRAAFLRATR